MRDSTPPALARAPRPARATLVCAAISLLFSPPPSLAADSSRAPTVAPTPPRPPPSTQSRALRAGRMTGRYLCAQGWTELTLEVTSARGASVEAVFDFVFQPRRVSGRYRLRGTRAANGEIELTPVAWITQPPGYVMVGMRGRVGADGVFRGRITHESCGEFFVVPT